ncbi:porin family protein [Lunatimonas salinarum]|uniref:porin family protein n=1 Tax=Lunatimonas salinarum TaxID=1774590 RepID=UPI001AE00214
MLIGCLIAVSIVQTQAQEFSIGPKLGISQADISVNGNGFSTGDSKLGYHLGLFARLGGNSIFLQPEILYTNTGGEIQSSQNQTQVNYSVSFNRIDVPVLFGFKLARFFRIQAGPALSFLISSEVDTNNATVPMPDYNRATMGYQAGIGVDIANMILDFKYEGPLGKQASSIAGFATDQRQNQLILSLGIRLF